METVVCKQHVNRHAIAQLQGCRFYNVSLCWPQGGLGVESMKKIETGLSIWEVETHFMEYSRGKNLLCSWTTEQVRDLNGIRSGPYFFCTRVDYIFYSVVRTSLGIVVQNSFRQ